MNIFVTVSTLAAVFVSSEAGPQGRITYGQIADEGQFPFNVGISKYSGRNADLRCGGAIISHNWVITAAHCVENFTEVTLHIGSTNFFTPNITFTLPASSIKMHPDYNTNTMDNDIALINTPYIQYTDTINAVRLPNMRDDGDVDNEYAIAMGWGKTETGEYSPNNLKYVYLRIMPHDDCQSYSTRIIDNRTFCAMTDVGSNCSGDSGGPLVMASNHILVGIFIYMRTIYCHRRMPVGFVRVTEYRNWIKSVSGVFRP